MMYAEALDYLTCPHHPVAPLTLEAGEQRAEDGEIVTGALRCPVCAARYPVAEGIADLLGPIRFPETLTQALNLLPLTAWGYERTWRPNALTALTGEPFGYQRELPLITGMAAPERGGLMVDVACSNGLYARALDHARGNAPGHVVGIDYAMPMLQQARAFARAEGLRISYVRARAEALPFGAGTASVLAMGGSLNEIGNSARALRELRRVLAPAGRVALMCLIRDDRAPGRAVQSFLGLAGVSFPTLDQLNRAFAAAGLRLRAQWRYRVVVFSLLTADAA